MIGRGRTLHESVEQSMGAKSAFQKLPGHEVVCRIPAGTILGDLYRYFNRHLILRPLDYVVMSSWVMATWHADEWDRIGHLIIKSPTWGCAKSRSMELLKPVCYNAKLVVDTSAPALHRGIELGRPTILLDEADCLSQQGVEGFQGILRLFKAGISKDAMIDRCTGQHHIPKSFPIYCPKAAAFIGTPDRNIADKSYVITIHKKRPDQNVVRCRDRVRRQEGAAIGERLTHWSMDPRVKDKIQAIYKDLPMFDLSNDRMAELYLPLQTVLIAESGAGDDNHALKMLREFAEEYEQEGKDPEMQDIGIRLLLAIREIFAAQKVSFIPTDHMIMCLLQRQDEPWETCYKGRPITRESLAGLLRPYKIKPRQNSSQTVRGYHEPDFRSTWQQYL